jgi:hypothetical protein
VSGGYLVMRRGGATWAVADREVRGLARRGAAYEVTVAAGALTADEVLGVTADLRLHPAGGVLRRFWPEAARGLAVHGSLPLVLIDAGAPPRSLLAGAAVGGAALPSPSTPSPPRPGQETAGGPEEGSFRPW